MRDGGEGRMDVVGFVSASSGWGRRVGAGFGGGIRRPRVRAVDRDDGDGDGGGGGDGAFAKSALVAVTVGASAMAAPGRARAEGSAKVPRWGLRILQRRMQARVPVKNVVLYGRKMLPMDVLRSLSADLVGAPVSTEKLAALLAAINRWYVENGYPFSAAAEYERPTDSDPTLYLIAREPILQEIRVEPLDRGSNGKSRSLPKKSKARTKPHILARILGVKVGDVFKWSDDQWGRLQQCGLFEDARAEVSELPSGQLALAVYVEESATLAVEPGITARMDGAVYGKLRVVSSNMAGLGLSGRVEWEKKVDQTRSAYLLELEDTRMGAELPLGWMLRSYREIQRPSVPSDSGGAAETVFNRDGCAAIASAAVAPKWRALFGPKLELIQLPILVDAGQQEEEEHASLPSAEQHPSRPRAHIHPVSWLKAVSRAIRSHERYGSELLGSQLTLHVKLMYDDRRREKIEGDERFDTADEDFRGERGEDVVRPSSEETGGQREISLSAAGPRRSAPAMSRILGLRGSTSFDLAIPVRNNMERFCKVSTNGALYLPLGPRSVAAIGGSASMWSLGTLPAWEWERIGGQHSVRGFAYGELGAVPSHARGTIELRTPLTRDVEWAAFVDGAVELHGRALAAPLGSSVGVGIRLSRALKCDLALTDRGAWNVHFGLVDPKF